MPSQPEPVHQLIAATLEPGEEVIWVGRPAQGFRLYWVDALTIPLAVLVGVVFFRFGLGSAREDEEGFAAIFFMFAGWTFFGAWQRIAWDRRRRARTFYALTDRRAVVLEEGTSPALRSVVLKTVKHLSHVTSRDGSGTIAFGQWWPDLPSVRRDMSARIFWRPRLVPSFEQIPDVQTVYELARNARSRSAR